MGKGFLKRKEALSRKIGLGCVVILVLTLLRYRIIHPFDDPSIRLRPFHLYRLGLISESDFSLFKVTDDIDEAIAEITNFYRNFHSYRYVGDQLVVRLQNPLSQLALKKLNSDYSSILKDGEIVQGAALPGEANEPELAEMPRLIMHHRRRDFGKFREFLNDVNEAELKS